MALNFLKDAAGATAIEYGLIISLIFLAIIGAVTSFGTAATGVISHVSTAITSSV